MQIVERTIKDNKAHLIPIGDTHLGLKEFRDDKFLSYREWILKRENVVVYLLGDIFETPINRAITCDEPITPNGMTVSETVAYAYELFAPIRDRIVAVVMGNHELRSARLSGGDALGTLVMKLGLEDVYDAEQVLVQLKVGKIKYSIVGTHGWGGARKTGGQVNKIEEMTNIVADADVYLTGHEHTLFLSRYDIDLVKQTNGAEIVELRQMFLGCGCFVDYTRFQKRIARRKPNIGSPRIRFNGTRRDVHASI